MHSKMNYIVRIRKSADGSGFVLPSRSAPVD